MMGDSDIGVGSLAGLTSRHLAAEGRPDERVERIRAHGQEKVEDEDRHKRQHERLGRGAADSFGPWAAVETAMASDQRQYRPEHQRLPQSREDIPDLDELPR